MAIISLTSSTTGLVGVYPRIIYINTTDTESTVVTAGYLTQEQANGAALQDGDMACVITRATPNSPNVDSGFYQVNVSAGVWSLSSIASPGDVTLPTTANHLATYTGTTGGLSEDAATAINGGNIQAGLSGTAGYLASFPSALTKGSLRLTAAASTGDTVTNITNAAFGQATTITIPDPGVATASFVLSDGGTQNFATGNLAVLQGYIQTGSSGHAGALYVYPSSGAFYSDIVSAVPAATQTITIPSTGTTAAAFVLTVAASSQTITSALSVTGGSITSGASTVAGSFVSFPSSAANGTLILAAANAGGAFNSTISNGTMGQTSVFTLPDPGNAVARILVGATATPFTTAHLLSSSGTGGLVADSGIATSNVQLKTQVKAVLTGNIGGTGAGPLTVTVAGMTSASVVVATVSSSSNPCYVLTAVPGSGSFALTVSADPGASLIVNYIAYIAAQ